MISCKESIDFIGQTATEREGEIVSTYTQDTVFRTSLGADQRKAFGQAVARTVISSGEMSPDERVLMVKQTCETFDER